MSKKTNETSQFVNIDRHNIDVSVFEPVSEVVGKAVLIHGAGSDSSKDRYLPLSRALANQGYKTLVFSFPGHGKSSGHINGSSLDERADIAYKLAQQLGFTPGTLLCGFSMGAHIAVSLLGKHPNVFERLALFVPAIYARDAQTTPFGDEFSKLIRQPGSYQDSIAWDVLPKFKGQLVTFQAGQDQVILPEVVELIHKNATNAVKHRVLFKECPHGIAGWLAERAGEDAVAKSLKDFNFSNLDSL